MSAHTQSIAAAALPRSSAARAQMRVCHIMSADLWAGAEVQVATTAAYLSQRPNVHLSAVLFNEGRLADELRRLGVYVAVVDETRSSAFWIVTFLTSFLKENEIDIVHTHRYKDTILGALAAKLARVPQVVRTVHGLREPLTGWSRVKFRAYEAIERLTLLCFVDLVIAVSKRMAETLRTSGYRPTTVTHIHNGIDLRKVSAARSADDVRRELGISDGSMVIGTAGRLSPVKGHAVFLRAARSILEKQPGAKFLIAGDGPLRAELVALAAGLGIERACVFAGSRSDVYDLIAAMDVFVLPSLNEGLPMALLEAMALGRPVVATAVGGVPEVVQSGVTGLLVPPGDGQALADACLELAADGDRARRLGDEARRVVQEEFSHEQNGEALVDAYRSVALIPKVTAPGRRAATPRRRITALGLCRGLARAGLDRGAREIRLRVEGRRMKRVRCHPAELRTILESTTSVLIVCHGNIIRSPFAAHRLRQLLGDRSAVSIHSAGLGAAAGRPAHQKALDHAAALQVDLSRHAASPLAAEQVAASDVIFVMDVPQLVALVKRFPEARGKTFLLTCLAPEAALEIADPVDGDDPMFQRCFDHISRAVQPILGVLAAPRGQSSTQSC